MPGPVPKRSEVRRRRNKPEGVQVTKAAAGEVVVWPEPDPSWNPTATRFYLSLNESGQRAFYQPSDVAVAVYVTDMMNKSMQGRVSGQLFAAVMSAITELMATEGARRRIRIELSPHAEDEEPKEDFVDTMAQYKADAEAASVRRSS